jgi:MFS transporter, ACS family, DAL5 transporter family protein
VQWQFMLGLGINLTWLNFNVAPHYLRATVIGFQQTIGNCAGIVAGQIYRNAPYTLGNSFFLGAICVSQVLIPSKDYEEAEQDEGPNCSWGGV